MSLKQTTRPKRIALVLLLVASGVFAAQLAWLRQIGGLTPSPLLVALFALAPLIASASFFVWWYLFPVAPTRTKPARLFFWLAAGGCSAFWVAFYWVFVLRAAMGVAA